MAARMEEQRRLLIHKIKKFPCLYEAKYRGNRWAAEKQMAWNDIRRAMGLPLADCQRMWSALRTSFVKLVRKAEESSDPNSVYEIRWPFYQHMFFIKPHLKNKKRSQLPKREEVIKQEEDTIPFNLSDDSIDLNGLQEGDTAFQLTGSDADFGNDFLNAEIKQEKREHLNEGETAFPLTGSDANFGNGFLNAQIKQEKREHLNAATITVPEFVQGSNLATGTSRPYHSGLSRVEACASNTTAATITMPEFFQSSNLAEGTSASHPTQSGLAQTEVCTSSTTEKPDVEKRLSLDGYDNPALTSPIFKTSAASDDVYHYCMSQVQRMRRLSPSKIYRARLAIEQVLYESEFDVLV